MLTWLLKLPSHSLIYYIPNLHFGTLLRSLEIPINMGSLWVGGRKKRIKEEKEEEGTKRNERKEEGKRMLEKEE